MVQPAEFATGMENAAGVVGVGNVVGQRLQLWSGVAHGNAEEGRCEHTDVIQAVAENDDVFRCRMEQCGHAAYAPSFIHRFDEAGAIQVRHVRQPVRFCFRHGRTVAGINNLVNARQRRDGNRRDNGFEIIFLAQAGKFRKRRITDGFIFRNDAPGNTVFIQRP